jgi:hypothetical protein
MAATTALTGLASTHAPQSGHIILPVSSILAGHRYFADLR